MKKVILILAALILVASGVAAVSAYEAHIINVKAHVENALWVNTDNIDFGTVFPQEWLKQHREICLSESAEEEVGTASGDLVSVTMQAYAEWKECDGMVGYYWDDVAEMWVGPFPNYYNWMGDFLYVGFDATQDPDPTTGMTLVGPAPAGPPSAKAILASMTLPTPLGGNCTQLAVAIDVPVFEGYYNNITDMLQPDGTYLPKPSGLDDPTFIIDDSHPDFDPDGMDFGVDLKIQVTNIVRNP
jgi:hypothetical protein